MTRDVQFADLVGQTIESIHGEVDDDRLTFSTTDGKEYLMYHESDCCEHVRIQDICGDFADLLGTPILKAEESSDNSSHPDDINVEDFSFDSYTWTFYRLTTVKGTVVLRWLGESNGYYSESVSFVLA